jgi:cytochrome c-type biogenesis protein CcmH
MRRPRRALTLAPLLVLLAVALPAGPGVTASAAAAPQPKVAISDIEDEVMCPVCGTLLELADSPQARREKAFVAALIAEGKSKDQVKDELVAQYGDRVLALPKDDGFGLAAYLVPIAIVLIALAAGLFFVPKWRRKRTGDNGLDQGPDLTDADTRRLEEDLARYEV